MTKSFEAPTTIKGAFAEAQLEIAEDEAGVPRGTFGGEPPTAIKNLRDAEALVYGDRNRDYGHPYDDYKRTAGLWSALLGVEITPQQAALMMVCVKLSREMHRPGRDNIVDGHGYLMVYDRIIERIQENERTPTDSTPS